MTDRDRTISGGLVLFGLMIVSASLGAHYGAWVGGVIFGSGVVFAGFFGGHGGHAK